MDFRDTNTTVGKPGHVVAIHQPNFFPWMGFFKKIVKARTFVFLDAVPFPRTSRGSWINRVRLLISGQAKWVTCPVKRQGGEQLIRDIQIDSSQPWTNKMINTLELNYQKAPAYTEVMPWLEALIRYSEHSLAEFNIHNIEYISNLLGLATRFIRQSDLTNLDVFTEKKSNRLVAICKEIGADSYLAGDGADEYEDIAVYRRAGLGFFKNEYFSLPYPQRGSKEFVPGLSIIDVLMNVGVGATARKLTMNQGG